MINDRDDAGRSSSAANETLSAPSFKDMNRTR
jgi:hypothetical protein